MVTTIHYYEHRVKKKNAKTDFEKYFFKLMNNAVFRKTMENEAKLINVKLVTTEEKENHLDQFFKEHLLAIEMKKVQIFINKPDYLGLSILELKKIVIYEFW